MSYARIASTASAKRYLEQSEATDRAAARRVSPAGARVLTDSGLTCDEWLRRYLDKNSRSIKRPSNTETIDGQVSESYPLLTDQSGEAQAAEVGDGQGLGNAPGQGGGSSEDVGGFDTPF